MNTIYLVWYMDQSRNVKIERAFVSEIKAMRYSDEVEARLGNGVIVYVDRIQVER